MNFAYLDPFIAAETIQLVEKLEHRPLHLAVTALLGIKPLRTDGVQLVNEDNSGCFLLCELERVPDQLRTVTNEHLH